MDETLGCWALRVDEAVECILYGEGVGSGFEGDVKMGVYGDVVEEQVIERYDIAEIEGRGGGWGVDDGGYFKIIVIVDADHLADEGLGHGVLWWVEEGACCGAGEDDGIGVVQGVMGVAGYESGGKDPEEIGAGHEARGMEAFFTGSYYADGELICLCDIFDTGQFGGWSVGDQGGWQGMIDAIDAGVFGGWAFEGTDQPGDAERCGERSDKEAELIEPDECLVK